MDNCEINDNSEDSDIENQDKNNINKSAQNTQLKQGAAVAPKIIVNKNIRRDYASNQSTLHQIHSGFHRARATFTQIRRSNSADAAMLTDEVLSQTTLISGKFKTELEAVIEEYAEESQATHELDLLLNLFEVEPCQQRKPDSEEQKSTSTQKQQRKAPTKTDGYAQQLFQTLETSDADYVFLKREHAAVDQANGINLLVKELKQSYGVTVAITAAPQETNCDNWMLIVDKQMAMQLVVGSKLKAFFDNDTINNAYSLQQHDNNATCTACFVQPNQILLSD